MRTLVLNAGYEPMQLISWQRALCLVLSQKAEVVAEYDHQVRSVARSFSLPSVVRLKRYVQIVKNFGLVRCTRKNILLRDRYQCQYCGVRCTHNSATIDHVMPRSKGGKTTWSNVVVACHPCNRKKGNRLLERISMRLKRKPRRPSWKELMADEDGKEPNHEWLPWLDYAG